MIMPPRRQRLASLSAIRASSRGIARATRADSRGISRAFFQKSEVARGREAYMASRSSKRAGTVRPTSANFPRSRRALADRRTSKVVPHLSLQASKRTANGEMVTVNVVARAWPAIVGVALLALIAAYVLLRWFR